MDKKQLSVTERIKTVEDAYNERGYNRSELTIPDPKHPIQQAANSFTDACVLTEALNEGWEPDHDDYKDKWEIIWDMRSKAGGGSGFSLSAVVNVFAFSCVGARLVFKDKGTAEYAAKNFPEVYKGFMKR